MQRIRALAWLTAAGLAALALTLLLQGDDPPVSLAALSADAPTAPSTPGGQPPSVRAPELRGNSKAQAALQEASERLRGARTRSTTTVAQLARTPRWVPFLETWLRLPEAEDDAERLARIQEALAQASGPVVRQNLIFLAALGLPLEVSQAWLEQLAGSEGAADAEDALLALAFTGERAAEAAFQRMARDADAAKVRRILDGSNDHEQLAARNDAEVRGVLRSYRAIEAYLREPYFKIMAFEATDFAYAERDYQKMVGWVDGRERSLLETVDLLRAWMERYPGHPGSDDMANHLAWMYVRTGDLMEAARWFSRAATLPDQDVVYASARALAGLVEIDLTPEQVLSLSEDEGLSTPNRHFLQYVWLRRLAAERGFDAALRALPDFARREPASEVTSAWEGRWGAAVPKGLDSGLVPLPANESLRRSGPSAGWSQRGGPHADNWDRGGSTTSIHNFGFWGGWSDWRLNPWPEVVYLDRDRLPSQMRAWSTLAELERRGARARGDARADLLYQQAAVFYHDRDVLFPLYGWHDFNFSSVLHSVQRVHGGAEGDIGAAARRARERFETTSLSYVRAMALFEQIEREHPHWAGMDKVIFSQGLIWRRLIDSRPSRYSVYWWQGAEDDALVAIRRTVATFERLIQRFPDSPLADDAAAAVAWWRRARSGAFAR